MEKTFQYNGRTITAKLVQKRCNENGNWVEFFENDKLIDAAFGPAEFDLLIQWWINAESFDTDQGTL